MQVNPATGAASCSFTCTPEGVQQLVTHTGTYDRWAEAVIENSYGRLSLLSDPVVLPTLYMPQGAAAGQNAFVYSEAPVSGHVQAQGYDIASDFHTVLVSAGMRMHTAGHGRMCWLDRHLCEPLQSDDCTPGSLCKALVRASKKTLIIPYHAWP
jgi:hypothetical protein